MANGRIVNARECRAQNSSRAQLDPPRSDRGAPTPSCRRASRPSRYSRPSGGSGRYRSRSMIPADGNSDPGSPAPPGGDVETILAGHVDSILSVAQGEADAIRAEAEQEAARFLEQLQRSDRDARERISRLSDAAEDLIERIRALARHAEELVTTMEASKVPCRRHPHTARPPPTWCRRWPIRRLRHIRRPPPPAPRPGPRRRRRRQRPALRAYETRTKTTARLDPPAHPRRRGGSRPRWPWQAVRVKRSPGDSATSTASRIRHRSSTRSASEARRSKRHGAGRPLRRQRLSAHLAVPRRTPSLRRLAQGRARAARRSPAANHLRGMREGHQPFGRRGCGTRPTGPSARRARAGREAAGGLRRRRPLAGGARVAAPGCGGRSPGAGRGRGRDRQGRWGRRHARVAAAGHRRAG